MAGIPVLRWILFMSSQEQDNHRCVVLDPRSNHLVIHKSRFFQTYAPLWSPHEAHWRFQTWYEEMWTAICKTFVCWKDGLPWHTLWQKSSFCPKIQFCWKIGQNSRFFWPSKYFDDFSSKIELMDKKWVLAPVCDRHKVKLIQYRIEECGRQEITTLE